MKFSTEHKITFRYLFVIIRNYDSSGTLILTLKLIVIWKTNFLKIKEELQIIILIYRSSKMSLEISKVRFAGRKLELKTRIYRLTFLNLSAVKCYPENYSNWMRGVNEETLRIISHKLRRWEVRPELRFTHDFMTQKMLRSIWRYRCSRSVFKVGMVKTGFQANILFMAI